MGFKVNFNRQEEIYAAREPEICPMCGAKGIDMANHYGVPFDLLEHFSAEDYETGRYMITRGDAKYHGKVEDDDPDGDPDEYVFLICQGK